MWLWNGRRMSEKTANEKGPRARSYMVRVLWCGIKKIQQIDRC